MRRLLALLLPGPRLGRRLGAQGQVQQPEVKYPAGSGIWFDSQAEGNYARFLDSELKAGRIKAWERQVRETLKVNDKIGRAHV